MPNKKKSNVVNNVFKAFTGSDLNLPKVSLPKVSAPKIDLPKVDDTKVKAKTSGSASIQKATSKATAKYAPKATSNTTNDTKKNSHVAIVTGKREKPDVKTTFNVGSTESDFVNKAWDTVTGQSGSHVRIPTLDISAPNPFLYATTQNIKPLEVVDLRDAMSAQDAVPRQAQDELDDRIISVYQNTPRFTKPEQMLDKTGKKKEIAEKRQALSDAYLDALTRHPERATTPFEKYSVARANMNKIVEEGTRDADSDAGKAYALMDFALRAPAYLTVPGFALGRTFRQLNAKYLPPKQAETVSKIGASLDSLAYKPLDSLLNTVEKVYGWGTNEGMFSTPTISDTQRETAKENLGNVGRFGYDVAMSIGDMAVAMATAGATGGGSLVSSGIMGAEKASEVMNEATKRGLTPNQIILEGAVSGITTAITEKIPMGKWADVAKKGLSSYTAKEIARYIASSAFSEGAQEALEDIADAIADRLIAGDKSQINVEMAQLMANGYSEDDAKSIAWRNWIGQTALDFLAGFISGGVMGGGNVAIGGANNNFQPRLPELSEDEQTEIENAVNESLQEEPGLNPLAEQNLVSDVENELANEEITNFNENNIGLNNTNENPLVLNPNQNAIPTEQLNETAPINSAQNVEVPNIDRQYQPQGGKTYVSQGASNTGRRSETFFNQSKESAEFINKEISKDRFTKNRVDEVASLEAAKRMVDENRELTERTILESPDVSQVQIDAAAILINDYISKNDMESAGRLMDAVVEKTHNAAQVLQALAKYTRTATGTMLKAKKLAKIATDNYRKSSKGKAQKNRIDKTVSEIVNRSQNKTGEKTSARLDRIIASIGVNPNENPAERVKLSHDELKNRVKNSLAKNFPNDENINTDYAIEYITNMIEGNMASWQIRDEIEHFLKHGEFYDLKPETEIKRQTHKGLQNILNKIGNKDASKPKVKKEITPEELRFQIHTTLNNEFASSNIRLDSTVTEFIAQMYENNVPSWIIQDEIEHYLKHGEFYTLDESIGVKPQTSAKLNMAFANMGKTKETQVAETKTLSEIKSEVRNTLNNEMAGIDNFTDLDVDYLARKIANGASTKELTDLLETRIATGSFGMSDADVQEIIRLFDEADKYGVNSRKANELHQKAYAIAAKYIGEPTFMDKWNAWRYLAMLGNPRTHIRNIVGNVAFGTVTDFKDTIAAYIEEAVDKASKNGIDRTKAVVNKNTDKAYFDAADKDFEDNAFAIATAANKWDERSEIERQRKVFGEKGFGGAIQKYNDTNNAGLDVEDVTSLKRKYVRAMAGYLKANGKTGAVLNSKAEADVAFAKKARDYAIEQARIATFRERNAVAQFINHASKTAANSDSKVVRGLGMLIESAFPFKNTPANILKQGAIEYNPLQLINALYQTGKHKVETNMGIDTSMTPAEIIDTYARGLTGASIFALGALLASVGMLRGKKDDNDDLFNEQGYSINIGNKSYTIDWLAPSALPLFMGAEIYNSLQDEDVDNIMDVILSVGEPVIEMSMLSGLSNMLDSIAYAKNGGTKATSAIANLAVGYLSQGIPTIGGQIARSIDKTRRDTYTGLPSGGFGDTVMRQVKKDLNKIPGLSFLNQPYTNAYGETEENVGGNFFGRLAYNMLSPGYYEEQNLNPLQKELKRLDSDESIETNFLPTRPNKSYDGDRLSPKDYTQYAEAVGGNYTDISNAVINDPNYQTLSDADKAEVLNKVKGFSNAKAKHDLFDADYSSTYSKMAEAYENGDIDGVVQYLMSSSLLDSAGIDKNSALGKELLGQDDLTAEEIEDIIGMSFADQQASQDKIADAVPTLDMDLLLTGSGSSARIDVENAIPYLKDLGLDDATQGEILYNNGRRSQKEIDAYNDMGGYEGVKQYYDIQYNGKTHGTSSVTKDETIIYLKSLGLSVEEINRWLAILGWKPDYTG